MMLYTSVKRLFLYLLWSLWNLICRETGRIFRNKSGKILGNIKLSLCFKEETQMSFWKFAIVCIITHFGWSSWYKLVFNWLFNQDLIKIIWPLLYLQIVVDKLWCNCHMHFLEDIPDGVLRGRIQKRMGSIFCFIFHLRISDRCTVPSQV